MFRSIIRHVAVRRPMSTGRKPPLAESREARRQLTMGWRLDSAHAEAPRVPILESIFDDEDIFAKPSDTLASARSPFVTPESPLAAAPSQIRGANALFVQALFQGHKLLRQCGARLEVPGVLTLLYFPPWHPVALGRKSRPALAVVPMHGAPYNGNAPALKPNPNVARLSRNPLDFAVWRQRTGRRLRRALFASMQRTRGFRDGLYVAIARRVPSDEQAQTAVARFAQDVAAASHAWADSQRTSVNVAAINRRLVAAKYAPVAATRRQDWPEDWREDWREDCDALPLSKRN